MQCLKMFAPKLNKLLGNSDSFTVIVSGAGPNITSSLPIPIDGQQYRVCVLQMYASRNKQEPLILTGSFVESSIANGTSLPFLYLYTSGQNAPNQQHYLLNTDILNSINLQVLNKDFEPAAVKSVIVALKFEPVDK